MKREVRSNPDITLIFMIKSPGVYPDWITDTQILNENLNPEDIEMVSTATSISYTTTRFMPLTIDVPDEIAEIFYWYREYILGILLERYNGNNPSL